MIATVAALCLVIRFRCAFEIGAGKVIQQNLKPGAEKILPALLKMLKERRLLGNYAIQAAVQPIFARNCIVHAQ